MNALGKVLYTPCTEFCAVQHCIVLVLYSAVQYSAVLQSTPLF